MKAYVIDEPGGPERLVLKDIRIPQARPGWKLIRIRTIGINRSEYFTRIGKAPTVKFPRVLGIECVGEVPGSVDKDFKVGQKVAALMGGMSRDFNGSYGVYPCTERERICN